MADLDIPADALPLLAYKIAPRQFDLSYRFSNISLRDQIVRGQTLIRTLVRTGLLSRKSIKEKVDFKLLICGAGAAGLAAAREAEAFGVSFILVEKGNQVPGGVLGSTAERYVSTAMYEWPHPNHAAHAFPLSDPVLLGEDINPFPSLKLGFGAPVLIKEFGDEMARALRKNLNAWATNFGHYMAGKSPRGKSNLVTKAVLSAKSKQSLKAMLETKISIHGVPLCDETLAPVELDDLSGTLPRNPCFRVAYIIYAVGFANESVTYAPGKKPYRGYKHAAFWRKDTISQDYLGFKPTRPRVGILGSGDGALQDALRCLVRKDFPHPLAIWNGLIRYASKGSTPLKDSIHVQHALARVAAADSYTTGGAIWSNESHLFQSLDNAFREIIDDLYSQEHEKLKRAIGSLIRTDVEKVSIVTQHGYFSKAYALNRFLVLLFDKVLPMIRKRHRVKLELLSGTVTKFVKLPGNQRGARISVKNGIARAKVRTCDRVIIRGGLDRVRTPSQLLGLSDIDTGRAELGRIPPPIRPVSIPE